MVIAREKQILGAWRGKSTFSQMPVVSAISYDPRSCSLGTSRKVWGSPSPVTLSPILYLFLRMERDAAFTQKKAERACLRVHLRDKYRLPKVRKGLIVP